jgi:hypothetical protein
VNEMRRFRSSCLFEGTMTACAGVEGAVRGHKGIHLADRCILTKLE